MANLDITKISDSLTDAAVDANELSNDKTLVKLINNIDAIKDTCAGFGGEIARVMPIKLKVEIDSLTGLYNQLCTTSRSVAEGLKGLVDYMDNIPLGELRKKSFMSTPNIPDSATVNQTPDTNGVVNQQPVAVGQPVEQADTAPKSALLKQESSDFWRNVRSNVKREAYGFQRSNDNVEENGGANFGAIKEGLKGHNFDFGDLNNVAPDTNQAPKTEWQSILAGLNGNANMLNESIEHNWDGKVEKGANIHMVDTIENTYNGEIHAQQSSQNDVSLDDVNIVQD